jgi:hypothetical protein
MPISLLPDIKGDSGMVKTSPPLSVSLLILAFLSGCPQNPVDSAGTGERDQPWYCFDAECWRIRTVCEQLGDKTASPGSRCVPRDMAWCPAELEGPGFGRAVSGSCYISESGCSKGAEKGCKPLT